VRFLSRLWHSARRPAVARRCFVIALAVGSILSLINQWDALRTGHVPPVVWLRIAANYLVPFVVSNLGALASFESERGGG
jgi:hypothetical protein